LILKRYINREVLSTCIAILLVLVLIFISSRFISYIQLAVEGVIPSSTVFQLVGLKIPSVAGFLLPLSFFIAILMTLGRLYSENEMAVIKSVGVSDFQLAKNMLVVAVFLAVVAAVMSFWLNPWATQAAHHIRAQGQAEARLSHFLPGRFKQNSSKTGVAFIESKSDDGQINQLFSVTGLNQASLKPSKQAELVQVDIESDSQAASGQQTSKNLALTDTSPLVIQLAQSGKITSLEVKAPDSIISDNSLPSQGTSVSDHNSNLASGEPLSLSQLEATQSLDYLQLQQGTLYTFDKQTQRWQITQYQDYFMPIEKQVAKAPSISSRSAASIDLLYKGDLESVAELHWRLSAPIAILILGFMAVPLARTQPRKGKFSRLLPAMMIYLIYAVLLMNGRKLIESGKIPEILGFWWIHLLAIAFCWWSYKKARFTQTKASKQKQGQLKNNSIVSGVRND
jgi:lipopolysaccharide export system permease protein